MPSADVGGEFDEIPMRVRIPAFRLMHRVGRGSWDMEGPRAGSVVPHVQLRQRHDMISWSVRLRLSA